MEIDEIKQVFRDNNVPLGRDDAWQVQGKWVMRHSALERLSAAVRITWNMPVIIRSERDEAVILVSASRADKPDVMEWSIGEALIVGDKGGNYKVTGRQASYPYAMAEKRGKDRVIIKLAGLHGAYSEEEAEDFRQSNSNGRAANDERPAQSDADKGADDGKPTYDQLVAEEAAIRKELDAFNTCDEVTSFMTSNDTKARTKHMPKAQYEDIRAHAKARLEALGFKTGQKAG